MTSLPTSSPSSSSTEFVSHCFQGRVRARPRPIACFALPQSCNCVTDPCIYGRMKKRLIVFKTESLCLPRVVISIHRKQVVGVIHLKTYSSAPRKEYETKAASDALARSLARLASLRSLKLLVLFLFLSIARNAAYFFLFRP